MQGGYGGPTGPSLVNQLGGVANQNAAADPMAAGGSVRNSSDTYSSIEAILKGW